MPTTTCPAPRHLSEYYDMSTVLGRLRYNWAFFAPINLRFGQAAVNQANATLEDVQAPAEEVRQALVVRAACAPQGEILPWPVRACGWALGGTPIIAFMVLSAIKYPTSLRHIFLGQFAN